MFEDDAERRSFAFFKTRTIPDISGYFPSDFWDRLVPLASFHEPALKHAVIALASLHERYEQGDESIFGPDHDIAGGGFALQQYNKAIRHLIAPPGETAKPSLDTSLVACVLFACFESLRGHHGSALSHIDSGVKILSRINDEERNQGTVLLSKGLCVPREDLDVIFMRLDTQKVQMVGTRPMSLPPVTSNAHPGFHPNIPAAFESMEEARNNLEYHWNLCLSTALNFEHIDLIRQGTEQQEHREAYERDRIYFQNEYKRWKSAFQAFLNANIANMDSKALRGAMVLKLSAHVAAMHLEITAFDILRYQTAFDELLPMYKELVELVAAIIDAESTPDNASKLKPIFQMDQSIITPLFAAAHKCRDPYVRRRAIALLYKVPRQEGVWNSILTARCAERIVKIEEEGLGDVKCCADVPDSVRISDVEVAFDLQQRRGFIKFSRLRSFYPTVREPITDVFEW